MPAELGLVLNLWPKNTTCARYTNLQAVAEKASFITIHPQAVSELALLAGRVERLSTIMLPRFPAPENESVSYFPAVSGNITKPGTVKMAAAWTRAGKLLAVFSVGTENTNGGVITQATLNEGDVITLEFAKISWREVK